MGYTVICLCSDFCILFSLWGFFLGQLLASSHTFRPSFPFSTEPRRAFGSFQTVSLFSPTVAAVTCCHRRGVLDCEVPIPAGRSRPQQLSAAALTTGLGTPGPLGAAGPCRHGASGPRGDTELLRAWLVCAEPVRQRAPLGLQAQSLWAGAPPAEVRRHGEGAPRPSALGSLYLKRHFSKRTLIPAGDVSSRLLHGEKRLSKNGDRRRPQPRPGAAHASAARSARPGGPGGAGGGPQGGPEAVPPPG